MVVPGPPSFFADGMMALPPPTAARSGEPSLGCSSAAACSYSPCSPTMAAFPYDSAGAPSASVAFFASSAPSSSPASMSGVRSSTKRPANGFSSTTTAAALRTARLASRPPSLRISSTTVTILRIFTMSQSPRALPPERRAAEPCEAAPTLNTTKHETVEQLGIEVRGLLRQHLPAAHDGLQLVDRRRRDEERRLIASRARETHRLGLVRRVVDVRFGVELGVRDVAERLQHALVEDRHGQLAPRARRARRPRQRVEGLRPQRKAHGALFGDDAERAVRRATRERVGERRDVEPAARGVAEARQREVLDVVHETMVGEDREAGPVEAEEGHELVVRTRMAPRVFHRRLVA